MEFLESKEEFKVRIGFILLLSHYLKVASDGSNTSRKKVVELADIEGESNHTLKYLDFIFEKLAKIIQKGIMLKWQPHGFLQSVL